MVKNTNTKSTTYEKLFAFCSATFAVYSLPLAVFTPLLWRRQKRTKTRKKAKTQNVRFLFYCMPAYTTDLGYTLPSGMGGQTVDSGQVSTIFRQLGAPGVLLLKMAASGWQVRAKGSSSNLAPVLQPVRTGRLGPTQPGATSGTPAPPACAPLSGTSHSPAAHVR